MVAKHLKKKPKLPSLKDDKLAYQVSVFLFIYSFLNIWLTLYHESMPYDYWMIMRYVNTFALIVLTYKSSKLNVEMGAVTLPLFAIVFNPYILIKLDPLYWLLIHSALCWCLWQFLGISDEDDK